MVKRMVCGAVSLLLPLMYAVTANGASLDGRSLFEEKCAMCHRAGGMGTGLLARRVPSGQEQLESRTQLSAALIKSVVRNGLTNMPRLSRAEVNDEQLDSIADYLSKGTP